MHNNVVWEFHLFVNLYIFLITIDTVGKAAPPESQWDRCVRLIVKESNKLQPGCLFVVTKQGLQLGRFIEFIKPNILINLFSAHVCVYTCRYLH